MIFNPFEKLTPVLLSALRKRGKRWLVSQSMSFSGDSAYDETKICLLMSHYEEADMAGVHLKALVHDSYAALIDLDRKTHMQQLQKILDPQSKYVVFSSLIRSRAKVEKLASDLYRDKYWKYVQEHSKAGVHASRSLRPSIQLIFGEIYIVLKYGAETLRTKLADIEKM